jgi:TolB protein
LHVVDTSDFTIEQVTEVNPIEILSPRLSPDKTEIVYEVSDESTDYGYRDIYIRNIDGTNARQLTFDPDDDKYPAWSPDGKQIVFTSSRNFNVDIYIINSDGSGLRRLTFHEDVDTSPDWRR